VRVTKTRCVTPSKRTTPQKTPVITPKIAHLFHSVSSSPVIDPNVSTAVGSAPRSPRSTVARWFPCSPLSFLALVSWSLFHTAHVFLVSTSTTSRIHNRQASKSSAVVSSLKELGLNQNGAQNRDTETSQVDQVVAAYELHPRSGRRMSSSRSSAA